MKLNEIAYIILSFILSATFLTIFFFTYVSSVESDIIKNQINDVITNFINSTNVVLTPVQKKAISMNIIDNLKLPDMSSDDLNAEKTNKNLLNQTLMIFGIIVGIGILIVVGLWVYGKFNMLEMVKSSLIILSLVVLTEFFGLL